MNVCSPRASMRAMPLARPIVIATTLALAACGGRQEPARERSPLEPSTDCHSDCMSSCLTPDGLNEYGPCQASCADLPYGPCPVPDPDAPTVELPVVP